MPTQIIYFVSILLENVSYFKVLCMPIFSHDANQTELISIGKDLSITGTEASTPAQTDSMGEKVNIIRLDRLLTISKL